MARLRFALFDLSGDRIDWIRQRQEVSVVLPLMGIGGGRLSVAASDPIYRQLVPYERLIRVYLDETPIQTGMVLPSVWDGEASRVDRVNVQWGDALARLERQFITKSPNPDETPYSLRDWIIDEGHESHGIADGPDTVLANALTEAEEGTSLAELLSIYAAEEGEWWLSQAPEETGTTWWKHTYLDAYAPDTGEVHGDDPSSDWAFDYGHGANDVDSYQREPLEMANHVIASAQGRGDHSWNWEAWHQPSIDRYGDLSMWVSPEIGQKAKKQRVLDRLRKTARAEVNARALPAETITFTVRPSSPRAFGPTNAYDWWLGDTVLVAILPVGGSVLEEVVARVSDVEITELPNGEAVIRATATSEGQIERFAPNLIANPGFEDGASQWNLHATASIGTSEPYRGKKLLVAEVDHGLGTGGKITRSSTFDAVPGNVFYIEAMCRMRTNPNNHSINGQVGVRWLLSAGGPTDVWFSSVQVGAATADSSIPKKRQYKRIGNYTPEAPANTVAAQLLLRAWDSGTAGQPVAFVAFDQARAYTSEITDNQIHVGMKK
jgi:hypothetical protein